MDHLPELPYFTNEKIEPQRDELELLNQKYGDHHTKEKDHILKSPLCLPAPAFNVIFSRNRYNTPLGSG